MRVRPPPPEPPPPGVPLECTASRVAPALDTVGAGASVALGVVSYFFCVVLQSMQSWSSDPQNLYCEAVAGVGGVAAATYTASALYGFHNVGACRERLAEAAPSGEEPAPARPLPPHLAPSPPP